MTKPKEPKIRIAPDDFYGNNAVFLCPLCDRAFVVSGLLDNIDKNDKANKRAERVCPRCKGDVKCVGVCIGSAKQGGEAYAYTTEKK